MYKYLIEIYLHFYGFILSHSNLEFNIIKVNKKFY